MAKQGQTRVILWGSPRSMTTAFYRAISNGAKTRSFFGPYVQAYYYGEERQSQRFVHRPPKTGLTYMDVKSTLEQDYLSDDVVFAKCLPYTVMSLPVNPIDILPKGYIHTFLIRHPERIILSLYKAATKHKDDGWGYFDHKEVGIQDLFKLYKVVTETLKEETIIIDADDLLKDPESTLRPIL